MNPAQEAALRAVDPVALGERIKAARVRSGLRQAEIGGTDVSVAHVSRIEAGKRRPSPALLESFAERLSLSIDDLLWSPYGDVGDETRLEIDFAELALENADARAAERHARSAIEALPVGHPLGARAAFLHARALEAQGRLREAVAELEPLAVSGTVSSANAAVALCRCLRETGELARSSEVGEDVLQTLRDSGLMGTDDAVQLVVTVAAAYFETGAVAVAARLCREAIASAEALGSAKARAAAYWNASMVEAHQGHVAEALPLAKRALALLSEGRDARNLARLRCMLGVLQLRSDPPQLDEAFATLTSGAEELRATSASPVDLGRNAAGLARLHLMKGDLVSSERLGYEAVDLVAGSGPLVEADARSVLGQAAARQDRPDLAQAEFLRAAALLTSIGADRSAAELWYELGACMDDLGLVAEARDAFRRAAASAGLYLHPGTAPRSDPDPSRLLPTGTPGS
jgi:tetratricopeptide (TPR) repeat protein